MRNIDWKRKLSSRKFWSLLIALVVAVLVFLRVEAGTIEQVVAIIGAFSSLAIYILAEAYVDGKRADSMDYFNFDDAIDTDEDEYSMID